MKLQNDLFLRALRGEEVERPPVWMMRQAGRYLPDFMKLKAKYSFFERAENPELATEITVMPIDQVGPDAAILFSDILVIPQALGTEVQIITDKGIHIPTPIRTLKQVEDISIPDMADRLHYVIEALQLTKKELAGRVPLIGFAGSPWTILCYMVEGKGSKDFAKAKEFCFTQPKAAKVLLEKITQATVEYLNAKVENGADAIQIFDSWGGLLSPTDYAEFSWPYIQTILDETTTNTYKIVFAKGCWYHLETMAQSGADALGVDWTVTPQTARQLTGGNITLQGNFDPSRLLSPIDQLEQQVRDMIDGFGTRRYIANLGHGILPNIPVEHAKAFVNAVKNYSYEPAK